MASHELKTPVTSMVLQIEVLNTIVSEINEDSESMSNLRKILGSANGQLNRLGKLIDDMLNISRINTGKLELNLKTIDLGSLTQVVMERFSEQLKALEIIYITDLKKEIFCFCDSDRIDQVITNFMTNAIRYGNKGPTKNF